MSEDELHDELMMGDDDLEEMDPITGLPKEKVEGEEEEEDDDEEVE